MDVLSGIKTRDLISWSSMTAGFSQLGYELEALGHFKEMLCQGDYQPNEFAIGSAFSACGSLLQSEYGRQIHGMSIKFCLGRDPFAVCSLSDTYAKCDLLDSAKTAFYQIESLDLVSINAIFAGFAYGGDIDGAMLLFSQMRHLGLSPEDITVRSFLSACTNPATLNQAQSKSIRFQVRSSLENESCSPGVSDQSSEPIKEKGLELLTPRWQCMTCLCSTIAFLNIGSSVSESKATSMDGKERPVCRNCGGSGAIILRGQLFWNQVRGIQMSGPALNIAYDSQDTIDSIF